MSSTLLRRLLNCQRQSFHFSSGMSLYSGARLETKGSGILSSDRRQSKYDTAKGRIRLLSQGNAAGGIVIRSKKRSNKRRQATITSICHNRIVRGNMGRVNH